MSQPAASTSTLLPPTPPTQQILTSFAIGLISILELWPALRLAVTEQWGGPESEEKRTWMASALVDAFEESPLDEDDVADLLLDMMSEEFDTDLEDGSPELVAKDVMKLWGEVSVGATQMLEDLERMVQSQKGKKVQAVKSGNDDEETDGDDDDEDDEEDEDEDMDKAPKLVARERQEPVVDEDGFTLVQGKGGKR